MYDVGILVVTYNQVNMTLHWLENYMRLFKDKNNFYLLLLDNNSTDNTYNIIKKQYPDVDIRKLNDNYGCTTGRNIGISILAQIGCAYYASFDADVFTYDPMYFDKLMQVMRDNPHMAGCCPVLRWHEDGSIQGMGAKKSWHGGIVTVNKITSNNKVDCLPGGTSFIRMDAFRHYGLYNNDLPPIGGQDYEWGLRVSKMGGKFIYVADIDVIHHHEKNRPGSPWTKQWTIEGRALILRKNLSLGNIAREILYIINHYNQYGIKDMLSLYHRGLVKKMDNNNYLFNTFCKSGIEKYYSSEKLVDG